MKAVPFSKYGIEYDETMCDEVEATADSTFEELLAFWIDYQAKEELGGVGGNGIWTFKGGDDEDWKMSGEELTEFIEEQVGVVPVGFWILEDLHHKVAEVPLEDTCEHGGATIHAVAGQSFQRICALLAVRVVGDLTQPGVLVDGGDADGTD